MATRSKRGGAPRINPEDHTRQKPEELITVAEASSILRLSRSAIYDRKAGTENLTHVRQGHGKRQRVYLIRSEVEQHLADLIDYARRQQNRAFDLVWNEREGKRR